MKMTILPVKLEKWAIDKMWPLIVSRAEKLYGRGSKETKNGLWSVDSKRENEVAYAAVLKDVWMYSSIYAIASSASDVPSGVYKRGVSSKGGEYSLDENNDITKLFNKPNPVNTRSEFIESIFWSLELSGKVFIECYPNKTSPQALFVLDPRSMTVLKDKDKFIVGYEQKVDSGKPIPFSTEEIIYHRYHNPTDFHEGLSASTAAGDSINSNILANQYNNSFFGNSAIPVAALESERRMTDDECDSLRMQWEKGYKNPKKAHRVAILYGGIKFNIIQRSPKDMEFTKQKLLNREETLAAYGVPPVLVGLLESVNYGNSKEQKKIFWQQTMKPKLRSLAERFTMEFGLDGFKNKFSFDLTGIEALQEDEEIKSRIAFNLSKSGFSWDEIRAKLYRLPPLPDGIGKYPWVPNNMVPSKLLLNGPIAAPSNSNKPGKPDGPSTSPGPEGSKPDANSKPASKNGSNGSLYSKDTPLGQLVENINNPDDSGNDELGLRKFILV